ncbi:hypothetical protein Taro_017233 [Colocasia esculenta]|uniref:Uncharacterized protein n=1 Tax=Colocasia esculenta TaxID=4460 RepID=A0A843UN18_COLES|nr:hypothetical protein [Colocasia esculenta]
MVCSHVQYAERWSWKAERWPAYMYNILNGGHRKLNGGLPICMIRLNGGEVLPAPIRLNGGEVLPAPIRLNGGYGSWGPERWHMYA